ncbi:hypothetical protein FFLO_03461 [Filobasidium floriforme]|uniref:Uncharacterized protein n=2 Tax=Filobasidium floriforme TaxID=5210 RepID=A0A8K0NT55_9TREE|nr:hypothetical protein FFLO_03461 [Filobasidium floriforme]
MYECVWNGRADYLVNGVERDWSFKDVVLNADGHVIMDRGDGRPHTASDELPLGLPKEFTKYLSKPDPYTPIVMRASPAEVQRLAGHENMEEKDDVERAVIGEVSKGRLERKSSGVALLESRM